MTIPLTILASLILLAILVSRFPNLGTSIAGSASNLTSIPKGVWYGVAGLVGLVVLVMVFNSTTDGTLNFGLWIPGVLLLALMILALMGRGGKLAQKLLGLGVLFLLVYFAFHFVFGEKAEVVANTWRENAVNLATEESNPTPPPITTTPQRNAVTREEKQVRWEGIEDDSSLPVGVWSDVSPIRVGCSVKFSFGEGVRVQYRYYTPEWKEYQRGTSPDVSELRFFLTTKRSYPPYVVSCN